MSQRFSIFSILALVMGLAVFAWGREEQRENASRQGNKIAASAGDASGDVLLDSALAAFENYSSIMATTRLQVHLRGHHLFGPGSYLQKGKGDRRRIRSEMVLRGRAGKFTFTQVNDSNRLWLLEESLDNSKLRLIDLQRLRDSGMVHDGSLGSAASFDSLQVSGLAGLMKSIQSSFRFGRAVQIEWNGKKVWAMRGVWRESMLQQIIGSSGPAESEKWRDQLPDWAPTEVGILLDIETLFPYRFEFLTHIGNNPQGQSQLEPVAILELLEIRLAVEIDESQFDRPSDIRPTDITKEYLRNAKL